MRERERESFHSQRTTKIRYRKRERTKIPWGVAPRQHVEDSRPRQSPIRSHCRRFRCAPGPRAGSCWVALLLLLEAKAISYLQSNLAVVNVLCCCCWVWGRGANVLDEILFPFRLGSQFCFTIWSIGVLGWVFSL